jgi:hypothetical protein
MNFISRNGVNGNLTFRDFLKTQQDLDPAFVTRVMNSDAAIESVGSLFNFCRERWSDQYPKDWRRPTSNMPFGREAMRRLWSRYLEWRETDHRDAAE